MVYIRSLIWDAWNIAHIARHDVTPEEVEEVCHGTPITSETYGGRVRLIGPALHGQIRTVILAPRGRGVYYPVTARPASRKERRLYQGQLGQQER